MSTAYPPGPRCRHGCGNLASHGRRGLCKACHSDPKIRRLYPMIRDPSKYGGRGGGYGSGGDRPVGKSDPPLPDRPTSALPGSEDKLLVLMERARKRQQLRHPLDRTADGDWDEDALLEVRCEGRRPKLRVVADE